MFYNSFFITFDLSIYYESNNIMWEYKRMEYSLTMSGEIDKVLNDNGSNNWEIIYYDEKKPKKFGDDIELIIVCKRLIKKEIL